MKKLLLIVLSVILCLVLAGCKNEENPQIEPSENQDSITESFFDEPIEDNDYESSSSGTLLFTTEYEVVDYVENAIIVSKNDGLLYGVLDNRGNEIIPVKYDEIDFINKENYINGIDDKLYFLARYEGVSTVLNINEEEILSTSRTIWYPAIITTDVKLKNKTDNSPYFIERLNYSYALYNEKGDFLYEVASPSSLNTDDVVWLSDSIFCCYAKSPYDGANISTYNSEEKQIDSIKGAVDKLFSATNKMLAFVYEKRILSSYSYSLEGMKLISINIDGIITIEKEFNTLDEYKQELEKAEYEYGNKKYNLYTSNGTWKLEDPEGNSLYDDRYYKDLSLSGRNECIFLTDEDNYITVVGRKGIRYIGSGVIEFDGARVYLLGFNGRQEIVAVHEGEDSIIVITNTSNGTNIYYYE